MYWTELLRFVFLFLSNKIELKKIQKCFILVFGSKFTKFFIFYSKKINVQKLE